MPKQSWLNERVPDLLRERAVQRIDEGQEPDRVANWLEGEGVPPAEAEQFVRSYLRERGGQSIRAGLKMLAGGAVLAIVGYLTFEPGRIVRTARGFPLRDAPFALAFGLLICAGGIGYVLVGLYQQRQKWRE